MSITTLVIGTFIGCFNILFYTYLFAESFVNPTDIDQPYGKFAERLPLLAIEDPVTYAIICLFMFFFSIFLVFGLVKKRPSLMWPWILAAFHVLGNYGYLMLHCLIQWITDANTHQVGHECVAVVISFFCQVVLYITVFNIFIRLFMENLTRRYEITRW